MLKVLLIEDNDADAYLVQNFIYSGIRNSECIRVVNMKDAELVLTQKEDEINVVLMGLDLPDKQAAIATFEKINKWAEKIPMIILTKRDDRRLAKSFVHYGAGDCLKKDIVMADPEHICRVIGLSIQRHLQLKKISDDRKDLQEELQQKEEMLKCFFGAYSIDNSKNTSGIGNAAPK